MRLYLDSSALVKLVVEEPASAALRRHLRARADDGRVTSALARVEVVRAVAGGGAAAVADARRVLSAVDQIALDRALLDDAADLRPLGVLRGLDAIHLASARLLGGELRAVVTYDRDMAEAAAALGLPVDGPT